MMFTRKQIAQVTRKEQSIGPRPDCRRDSLIPIRRSAKPKSGEESVTVRMVDIRHKTTGELSTTLLVGKEATLGQLGKGWEEWKIIPSKKGKKSK